MNEVLSFNHGCCPHQSIHAFIISTPVCDHPSRGEFSPLLVFSKAASSIFLFYDWLFKTPTIGKFCPWLVSSPIHFRHCWCFSIAAPTILFSFFLHTFSIATSTALSINYKVCNPDVSGLDNKNLPSTRPTLARSRCIGIVDPTLAKLQAFVC